MSTTLRPPKRRRLPVLIGSSLIVLLLSVGWVRELHGTGWSQTVNPVYWYRRLRGEDLYVPAQALLLHGNHIRPEVALTFDDGPHPESRARILDILKQYGARATFFDVGRHMSAHPDLIRRTLAEGHEVANHSYNHNRLDTLSPERRHREINDTDIAFARITGRHLNLLRPPGMRYNREILAETKELGYIVVGYSSAAKDYDRLVPADSIADRSLRRVSNGAILLLHDYPATAVALPGILEELHRRGFRCVTISELIAHLPEPQGLAAREMLATGAEWTASSQ